MTNNVAGVILIVGIILVYVGLSIAAFTVNRPTYDFADACEARGGFAVQGIGGKLGCLQEMGK